MTLTSADSRGRPQTAQFSQGAFRINLKTLDGFTEAVLRGNLAAIRRCARSNQFLGTPPPRATAQTAATKRRKRAVRKLFGSGKGRFRTKGYYGSATVRGTKWLVEDYCDGTLLSVTQGFIDIRDFPAKKTVRLRFRGTKVSYFARNVPLTPRQTTRR